ncbi:MAG TPA: MotA/TolQ/ExbB proton channel family protein [Candidatus Krumholzibacteria bacterium]|nr:MotA/TolQ/ExbB proton channel family protein [Candidatus Krumholzibacteria bacterium]
MALTPDDMVVSRYTRFADAKLSDQLLKAAIEERARRLETQRRRRSVPVDHAALRARRLAALQAAGKLKPRLKILREPLPPEKRLDAPTDDKKARRWTVRGALWLWFVIFGSLGVGWVIFKQLPENIQAGGVMVAVLIALAIIISVIILERLWTIRGAKGRESLSVFVKKIQATIQNNDLEGALDLCRRQRGALANVVYAGVDTFMATERKEMTDEERMEETRRALEEANALETPLLERNLVFLSTIASIATMTGLTGTTRGMIRAFSAMSSQGMPDATQLALGISEALWNTLLGLVIAQVGIIAFNYFSTRVDNYNFMMDETVHEILQLLSRKEKTVVA